MQTLTTQRSIAVMLAVAFVMLAAAPIAAQEEENPYENAVLLSANLVSPIVGIYTGSVEFGVTPDMSVFLQPEYFNFRWSLVSVILGAIEPEFRDYDFNITMLGGRVGLHYFIDGVHDGFFVGGNAGYSRVGFRFEGRQVRGNAYSAAARGGYRLIYGPVALTPYGELGVNYLSLDYRELFEDLGLDDAVIREFVQRSFGITWGIGLSIALALY